MTRATRISPRRWPWWLQTLAVYLASRLWTLAIFLYTSSKQGSNYWSGPHPSFFTMVGKFWDASWYSSIAAGGYPSVLPVNDAGNIAQNQWAFFPLFPALARGVSTLTRLPWDMAAPLLAVVLGGAAMLVIDRLLTHLARPPSPVLAAASHSIPHHAAASYAVPSLDAADQDLPRGAGSYRGLALGTVALISFFPASAVFSAAYTESLGLLLIATFLLLLVKGKYEWAALTALAVGFSRAVALPLAVVVLAQLIARWWQGRKRSEPIEASTVWRGALTLLACIIGGFEWLIIAGIVTHYPNAYMETQLAWRNSGTSTPVLPWVKIVENMSWWTGSLVLLGFAALIALMFLPAARKIGLELRVFGVAYIVYLIGVTEPNTSIYRFVMLDVPVFAVLWGTLSRVKGARILLLGLFAALECVWVWYLWRVYGQTALWQAP